MNCDHAVVTVKPHAFLRAGNLCRGLQLPIRLLLSYLLGFFIGILLYLLLSPSAERFISSDLLHFLTAAKTGVADLPSNMLSFLDLFL